MKDELCSCGEPLHYTNTHHRELVQELVNRLGSDILVRAPSGSYMVPRHYIALHGLKSVRLSELAARYGWRRIP